MTDDVKNDETPAQETKAVELEVSAAVEETQAPEDTEAAEDTEADGGNADQGDGTEADLHQQALGRAVDGDLDVVVGRGGRLRLRDGLGPACAG